MTVKESEGDASMSFSGEVDTMMRRRRFMAISESTERERASSAHACDVHTLVLTHSCTEHLPPVLGVWSGASI